MFASFPLTPALSLGERVRVRGKKTSSRAERNYSPSLAVIGRWAIWFLAIHVFARPALLDVTGLADSGTVVKVSSGIEGGDFLARISRARSSAASMWAQTFSRPRRSRKPERSMANRG